MTKHNCPWCRDQRFYELESANGGLFKQYCEHCQPTYDAEADHMAKVARDRALMAVLDDARNEALGDAA